MRSFLSKVLGGLAVLVSVASTFIGTVIVFVLVSWRWNILFWGASWWNNILISTVFLTTWYWGGYFLSNMFLVASEFTLKTKPASNSMRYSGIMKNVHEEGEFAKAYEETGVSNVRRQAQKISNEVILPTTEVNTKYVWAELLCALTDFDDLLQAECKTKKYSSDGALFEAACFLRAQLIVSLSKFDDKALCVHVAIASALEALFSKALDLEVRSITEQRVDGYLRLFDSGDGPKEISYHLAKTIQQTTDVEKPQGYNFEEEPQGYCPSLEEHALFEVFGGWYRHCLPLRMGNIETVVDLIIQQDQIHENIMADDGATERAES